ncbi:unnamed protein product [Tilletia laevis]|uniref:Transcription factor CBF/NF-Y/archaeal histone domain-containing protein n=2 Tax=Tilletia TaxID=13289 RepID=A0A177VAK0_9BASI|nr:hypothetical protein CF336_g2122 [Tilletia laevis]KAE8202918.1 hypothetical protein CF328_g1941 [Tilletia controversa]KAE8263400.1 hypothetical protein A4X03_0g1707 [Tilletia caries]KAE8206994.1 hypothetical protein CF335_g1474 [Tilletia laevis]CAD6883911.1 unnamed protein product [Tilletia caries]
MAESSKLQAAQASATVRPGQSLDDFQRAFWSHQIKVVESDDMDSLLVRVGTSLNSTSSTRESTSPGPNHATQREDTALSRQAQASEGASSGPSSAAVGNAPATGRLEPFPIPLARIKKVIKSNDEVSMVSSEAPVLLARACEILIADLTSRAFLVADSHRRRTIQRSDVRDAIAQTDVFDFAIDILPRDPVTAPTAFDPSSASM